MAASVWLIAEERKRFFFEKKKQKTFGPAGVGARMRDAMIAGLWRRGEGVDGPVKPGHDVFK
jgi:hypothetical protein